jgi:hypothetical protein
VSKKKINGQFVPITADLLASDAWRALGINESRVIWFLCEEHMRHAGNRNGFLFAPRRQLEEYGIHPRAVSEAIDNLAQLGLISVKRGVGRRPSYYALNWLPLADENEPNELWRNRSAKAEKIVAARKAAKARSPRLCIIK